jgi:hypothetical protein
MAVKTTSKTTKKSAGTKKTTAKAATASKDTSATKKAASTGTKKSAAAKKGKTASTTKAKAKGENPSWHSAGGNGSKPSITVDERQRLIGEAAYVISLKRDPNSGDPAVDWIQAEAVIDMIFTPAD